MQVEKQRKFKLFSEHRFYGSQVDFIEKIVIFSAAWPVRYASAKSKKIRSFFRSINYTLCKSKKEKKSKNMQKLLWASAADPGIKLCPRWAGPGPWFDFMGRPEPPWR